MRQVGVSHVTPDAESDSVSIMPNPGKGGVRHSVRMPEEQKRQYEREAADLGLELSDYLGMKLAEAHGLPRPPWIRRSDDSGQGVLAIA